MQLQAITHIPLSKDAYMVNENTIVIRLKVGKGDIKSSDVYYGDRVCMSEPILVKRVSMKKIASDELFDYFEGEIKSEYTRVCYYFHIKDIEGKETYYSEYGFSEKMTCCRTQYFQFPYLHRNYMICIPKLTENMVMYHIFPDSFAEKKNYISGRRKVIQIEKGLTSESKNGGTLRGILENLDYIEELNVNCLYLNPIFKAASYHKYDTIDYMEIDPCFGTKQDLKDLVNECHKRGIRVILDGVFNHCGSGFLPFLDVLKNGEKSEYCNWFYKLNFPVVYDTIPNYEAFAYVKEMPKLNTGNQEVIDYFCKVGRYWIREADIDGWRLDVAADLGQSEEFNHQFWRDFRTAVKEANPEAIILAEHYDDAGSWLMGDQWDTIMNYSAFMEPVTWFLTGMEKHSDERRGDLLGNTQAFVDAMVYHMSRFQYPSLMVSMNELSNHDHSRFLTRTNQTVGRTASLGPEAANQNINKGIMRAAVMIQMTWPGAPTLYYGDEAGLCGWTDPDNRRTYPWGREDQELIQYHRDIIAIHKTETALMRGSLKYLHGGFKVICYGRFTDTEKMIVLINAGFDEVRVKISVWEVGVTDNEDMVEVIMSNEEGYTMEKKVHPVTSGVLDITLPRVSSILLKSIKKS